MENHPAFCLVPRPWKASFAYAQHRVPNIRQLNWPKTPLKMLFGMGKIQPRADKAEPDFFFNCCSETLQVIVASGTELRAGSTLSWALVGSGSGTGWGGAEERLDWEDGLTVWKDPRQKAWEHQGGGFVGEGKTWKSMTLAVKRGWDAEMRDSRWSGCSRHRRADMLGWRGRKPRNQWGMQLFKLAKSSLQEDSSSLSRDKTDQWP